VDTAVASTPAKNAPLIAKSSELVNAIDSSTWRVPFAAAPSPATASEWAALVCALSSCDPDSSRSMLPTA